MFVFRSNTSPNLRSARIPPPLSGGRPDSVASNMSECCHRSPAGQELCYLCHQRDNRNIPVDFSAERQKRIEEEVCFLGFLGYIGLQGTWILCCIFKFRVYQRRSHFWSAIITLWIMDLSFYQDLALSNKDFA